MKAVIIAAGLGSRLGDLTSDRPKALVPVAGRELILRALDFVDHPAVTERLVVTGFEGDRLARFLEEKRPDVATVRNPHFRDGSIRTIELALNHVDGDFLLMNVDHIYPRAMFERIANCGEGITAICDFDRRLVDDDMKVKLRNGKLVGIRKTLSDYDGGYIGMTFVHGNALSKYREAVETAHAAEGDSANVEAALANLACNDEEVKICDVSGIGWLEVDTQEDLERAEMRIRHNPRLFT